MFGLECIAHNANRKNADLKFFEFGNCYYFREENKCPDIVPGVSSSRDPEVINTFWTLIRKTITSGCG